MGKISVHPDQAKLPFKVFAKNHKKDHPDDPMTLEERYLSIGGKLPKQKKEGD